MTQLRRTKKAFTLLETLMSGVIIILIVTASLAAGRTIQQSTSKSMEASRMNNLAFEGLDQMKAFRDSRDNSFTWEGCVDFKASIKITNNQDIIGIIPYSAQSTVQTDTTGDRSPTNPLYWIYSNCTNPSLLWNSYSGSISACPARSVNLSVKNGTTDRPDPNRGYGWGPLNTRVVLDPLSILQGGSATVNIDDSGPPGSYVYGFTISCDLPFDLIFNSAGIHSGSIKSVTNLSTLKYYWVDNTPEAITVDNITYQRLLKVTNTGPFGKNPSTGVYYGNYIVTSTVTNLTNSKSVSQTETLTDWPSSP